MKRILKSAAFVLLAAVLFYVSCKKEYSCENCIGNNKPPVAHAGKDTTIILPADSVMLDGSASTDPDNNITGYAWTKISGPSSFNISNSNAVQTQVTNLVLGTYQFELKVTDAGGLFSKDTMRITLNASTTINNCDISNRPLITAQLIPIGTLSQARAGMTVALANNKIVFAGRRICNGFSNFFAGGYF